VFDYSLTLTQKRTTLAYCTTSKTNKKLSYHRDSARCEWNCHSRSLKFIRCYANRRGIYDILL